MKRDDSGGAKAIDCILPSVRLVAELAREWPLIGVTPLVSDAVLVALEYLATY